jgi:hypothetical protein
LPRRPFPVEIVGHKNKLTYRWVRKASRPRATHNRRTQSTYFFGAVCAKRGTGAAFVLLACTSETMRFHLDEIGPDYPCKIQPSFSL